MKIAATVEGACAVVLNNAEPMRCMMNATAPCDRGFDSWQKPMNDAVANGSAPVLQDDGSVWSAVGAGHDDVVLFDARCRVFAVAKKAVADVADEAGAAAVAVLAATAASDVDGALCPAPAPAAAAKPKYKRRRFLLFLIFAFSFATGGLAGGYAVHHRAAAKAAAAADEAVFSPLGFGTQMVRRRTRSADRRSSDDDDDDEDEFDNIAL